MKQKTINFIKTILKKIKLHIIMSITIIIIFSLSLLGPLIVKLIINNDTIITLFSQTWTASDALSYYSAIVAAVIGVLGIYITIWHSNKKYRDDIRNQTLPFFAFHILMKRITYPDNWLLSVTEKKDKHNKNDEWIYSEYKLRNVYFTLNDGNIICTDRLKDDEMKLIQQDGNYNKIDDNGAKIDFKKNHIIIPYEIENVGNGPAINTRIGFNKSSALKKEYIKPENLKIGDSFSIHIFCNNVNENITGEYILEIYYFDIYNNKYCQAYKIKIEKTVSLNGTLVSTDYQTIQKRVY